MSVLRAVRLFTAGPGKYPYKVAHICSNHNAQGRDRAGGAVNGNGGIAMHIENHRFRDHWFDLSGDVGGPLTQLRFIVMHYTAGGSGESSRDYMLKSPAEKQRIRGGGRKVYASAHIVVDRDGSIWQIVPFDLKARHAGKSSWRGLHSLNQYSIGIEIANYGWLDRQGDGTYRRSDTPVFQPGEVTVAPMPGGSEVKGWENYPLAQLEAVEKVTAALLAHYPSIMEIVGHQEISPGRKFDPGPAFPLQRFRNLVDDRGVGAVEGEADAGQVPDEYYLATTRLNIRSGPGVVFEKLDISPLTAGTKLRKHDEERDWYFVSLTSDRSVKGWVHSRYARMV